MMKNIPKIVQFTLIALGLIFCFMIIRGIEEGNLNDTGLTGLNGAIWVALILMVLGLLMAIGFWVFRMMTKGRNSKITAGGVLVGLGYLGLRIGRAVSRSGDVATVDVDQMVSMGIYLFLALLFGVILAIIVGEARSMLS